MLLIILLSIVLGVSLAFCKYMGFFDKITVKQLTIEPSVFIYTVYVGNYNHLFPIIKAVKKDLYKYCEPDSAPLSFAKSPDDLLTFGIYYDSPSQIKDVSKSRAILGASFPRSQFSNSQLDHIVGCLNSSSSLSYRLSSLDFPLRAFGAEFPLINPLSIFYGIFVGYPAIKSYGESNNLLSKTLYSIETYDRANKKLTICFPYGENIELLDISGIEKPEYHAK